MVLTTLCGPSDNRKNQAMLPLELRPENIFDSLLGNRRISRKRFEDTDAYEN